MKMRSLLHLALAGAAVALTACSDSTSLSLTSDTEVTADVVATAGDALAADVGEMLANEVSVGAALPAPPIGLFQPPSWNVVRTRVCYDAQNVAQTQCSATTTASIVFNVSINGSVERTHQGPHGSESMTIAVHRTRQLTISGLLGTETSRIHDGFGTSRDTATFTGTHEGATITRVVTEASNDSAQAVTFNLPHSTNPWPVSGVLIRNSSGTVDVTSGERHESRSFSRRVVVTFPADAQGNVSININGKACTLNLVTHVVANCST